VFYHEERELGSEPLNEDLLEESNCVVIVADHSCYDYSWIAEHCSLLVDTKNATGTIAGAKADIVRLGAPGRLTARPEGNH
jgi:UDP-N-acetyl-D-glucosamine dehydrogenase